MDRFSLQDRVALVTGAGRGIGEGIARALAEAGAAVAVVARTQSDIDGVAAGIRDAGGRAIAIAADVQDLSALPGVLERTVEEFGGLDILVNNAGGEISPQFMDLRPHHLEEAFHFNVVVPFQLSQLAVPHLLQRPGASIINLSSSTAMMKSIRGGLSHHTAKAAEAQLTRSMAADLGPKIRVNALLPSAIATQAMWKHIETKNPAMRETLTKKMRLGRLGTPDDIGSAAIFLASPAASWITGLCLVIDGGAVDEGTPVHPDL
jgi:7-alpha-hydroxysteroid dehydrogenase